MLPINSIQTSLIWQTHTTTRPNRPKFANIRKSSVMIWGRGDRGQLGMGKCVVTQPIPTILPEIKDLVTDLACGANHTILKTFQDELYSFGMGTFGVLGHLTENDSQVPTKIESIHLNHKKYNILACGGHHTLCAVESNGERQVFGWGRNRYGQLGVCETSGNANVYEPREITFFRNKQVTAIGCGDEFSVVCTKDTSSGLGEIYTFGKGDVGQNPHRDEPSGVPKKLDYARDLQPITKVSCGWGHCLVLTQDGRVISWGANKHGQCGHGVKSEAQLPKDIKMSNKMVDIACGSCHSAMLCEDGNVYIFGSGKDGKMLDIQGDQDLTLPRKVEFLDGCKAKQVACGTDHIVVLCEDGTLRVWGFGQHGTLGLPTLETVSTPQQVQTAIQDMHFVKVACGMDVTVALIDRSK